MTDEYFKEVVDALHKLGLESAISAMPFGISELTN